MFARNWPEGSNVLVVYITPICFNNNINPRKVLGVSGLSIEGAGHAVSAAVAAGYFV